MVVVQDVTQVDVQVDWMVTFVVDMQVASKALTAVVMSAGYEDFLQVDLLDHDAVVWKVVNLELYRVVQMESISVAQLVGGKDFVMVEMAALQDQHQAEKLGMSLVETMADKLGHEKAFWKAGLREAESVGDQVDQMVF